MNADFKGTHYGTFTKKQLLGYGIDIKSVPFHSFPIKKVAFFHQKKSLHHWNKSGDGELFCFRLLLNSHN